MHRTLIHAKLKLLLKLWLNSSPKIYLKNGSVCSQVKRINTSAGYNIHLMFLDSTVYIQLYITFIILLLVGAYWHILPTITYMVLCHIQALDLIEFIVFLGAHSTLLFIIFPGPTKILPLAFPIRGNLYILGKIPHRKLSWETMQKYSQLMFQFHAQK